MKKILFIFSSVLLLAACNKTESTEPVEVTPISDQQNSPNTEDPVIPDTLDTNENDNSMAGDPNLDAEANGDYMSGKFKLEEPLLFSEISSPVTVKGSVPGTWFFEGSFPVKLLDDQGKELATTSATSSESWMTEDIIPFEAKLTFDPGAATSGKIVLQKDNPSGLPENDQKVEIPVKF